MSMDDQTANNFFKNILDLWIYPEINKRLEQGKISKDTEVRSALIIMNPDKNTPEVRINNEVGATVITKYKSDKPKKVGELVYEHEIDEHLVIEEINKDPNSAYIILIRVKDLWTIKFDGTWNKARAKQRFDTAKEFYQAAKLCIDNKLLRPFIDNLYSAVELLATSQLLLMADKKYTKKQTHPATRTRINSGQYNPEHKSLYNKLYGLRDAARYLNKDFVYDAKDGIVLLNKVDGIMTYTEKYIQPL
jgi:hypothetical protein